MYCKPSILNTKPSNPHPLNPTIYALNLSPLTPPPPPPPSLSLSHSLTQNTLTFTLTRSLSDFTTLSLAHSLTHSLTLSLSLSHSTTGVHRCGGAPKAASAPANGLLRLVCCTLPDEHDALPRGKPLFALKSTNLYQESSVSTLE